MSERDDTNESCSDMNSECGDIVESGGVPKICLEWRNIKYTVKTKDKKTNKMVDKEILHGIEGLANPGEMLGIMGSSGSGKTTLLNILCGNIEHDKDAGPVTANGQKIDTFDFSSYRGFVMQDDILLDTMTPRECLIFSSVLRTKGTLSEHTVRADRMLADLSLVGVKDNRVGSIASRGISGGQRKRTCIGIELITSPSVLFLDEPTSGLDSFVALEVLELLKNQATEFKRTIITTIHQPSTKIFNEMDRLILVSRGNIMYQGAASECAGFFDSVGLALPSQTNPADHYIKMLNTEVVNEPNEEEAKRLDDIQKGWADKADKVFDAKTDEKLPKLDADESMSGGAGFCL